MDLKNMTSDDKYKWARNPSTPLDILRKLAKDKNWGVRAGVAGNSSTPVDVLRALAKDEHWGVRCNVAENPSTPEDTLRDLAKDGSPGVRWRMAKNPNSSSKLLVMLFEYEKSLSEPDEYVIQALYRHKNLPAFAKRVIETLFGEML